MTLTDNIADLRRADLATTEVARSAIPALVTHAHTQR
jgi:hypothetical protein